MAATRKGLNRWARYSEVASPIPVLRILIANEIKEQVDKHYPFQR